MVRPGKYKHYKGGIYRVLFTALDATTDKPVVVYVNEKHGTYYTRDLTHFKEEVEGKPRFEYVGDSECTHEFEK